jgi:hypothetical protein
VLAIAALLAAESGAAAETVEPVETEAHSAYTSFKLVTDRGLQVHVEGHGGEVRIEVRREGRSGGRFVFYEVAGESTEAGLKAQFGQLGLIDVAFKPTKTRHAVEPPKGCEGEPTTYREGIFTGTIHFAGEREYTRVDATRVEGKMNILRESEWQCPNGSRRLKRAARPAATSPRKRSREKEAFLTVGSARCSCALLVSAVRDRDGRGPTGFLGVQQEDQEGMKVTRGTYSEAGPSAFTFDYATGAARVHPPRPFSGDATFKRRPHGHNLWRSTIQVPFLGVGSVSIGGRNSLAILHRHIPYDE